MKISALHIGMRVRHPQYGEGEVKTIGEHTAEIAFADGRKAVEPEASNLQPAEARASISGLDQSLKEFVAEVVDATVSRLGLENPREDVELLGARWNAGKVVMHPA